VAAAQGELQEGESMHVEMSVNGESHAGEVEPRTLLAHHLRDELGLTGTNIGCDTILVATHHRVVPAPFTSMASR